MKEHEWKTVMNEESYSYSDRNFEVAVQCGVERRKETLKRGLLLEGSCSLFVWLVGVIYAAHFPSFTELVCQRRE